MDVENNHDLRDEVNASDRASRGRFNSSGWWHSIDLGNGEITPGARSHAELHEIYASFGLPEDLTGKRVLDIGCWDGFFSFEMERHGADVVAIDCWRPQTFFEARQILNSRVEFHEKSVYELTRNELGSFDIVLMLGVLYHLQHPLLALQRVCELSRNLAIIESHVVDNVLRSDVPIMEYYEMDELGGQYDNWWGPNVKCMTGMLRTAGFVRTEVAFQTEARAAVKAWRAFPSMPSETLPSIELVSAVHSFSFQKQVPRRGRHAFLSLFANGLPKDAKREDVKIQVGSFGASPSFVGPVGNPEAIRCQMQINAPMPLGLDLGAAEVRIFCGDQSSSAIPIEIIEGTDW